MPIQNNINPLDLIDNLKEIQVSEDTCQAFNGDIILKDTAIEMANGEYCSQEMFDSGEVIVAEDDGQYYCYNDDNIRFCEEANEYVTTDNAVYIDGHGWYWSEDDNIVYSECLGEHCHITDVVSAIVNRRGSYDYVWHDEACMYGDEYYSSEDVAADFGWHYCDRCEDDYHEDEGCNCSGDENGFQEFDNQWRETDRHSMAEGIKWGFKSPTFRKTFGMQYTFGVEIETSDGCIVDHGHNEGDFNLSAVYDGSISGPEYVTGKLIGDAGLNHLANIVEAINSCCYVDKQCGMHIHIGGPVYNRRMQLLMLKLGYMIQNEIYLMMPPSRRRNGKLGRDVEIHGYSYRYCLELPKTCNNLKFNKTSMKHLARLMCGQKEFNKVYNKKLAHPNGHYNSFRYHWLNLVNTSFKGINTAEFRPHSATTNYTKIYNWLLICMSFVNFVENNMRRVYTSRMDLNPITLDEIIKFSVKDYYPTLSKYIKERKLKNYDKRWNEWKRAH